MTLQNKWVNKTLRDLANVRVSNVDKKSYATERPVRLCNYMDVYVNDYLTSAVDFMLATASLSEIERFAFHAGDVVITKDSETPDDIGVPAVIVEEINGLVCGYHLALIRPNANVHPIYLAKQLASASTIRYFAANATGSTRFGLAIGTIENLKVPTPPIAEQAKIAEVLSTVDRAIEETETLIDKQQRIKTGLMQDLLTRGIDKHGNLRSEQTHEFKDSPLGRIPAEWGTVKLDELVSRVGSGVTPRGGESVYTPKGVLFIRSQNVHFDGLRLNDATYIPERTHLSMLRSEIFENDVLLNITGASIGRCCRMPKIDGCANVNQHVCTIRLRGSTEVTAGVLAAVIESQIGQHQIAKLNAGGNREGLNYQQVRSLVLPWPSDNSEFARIYSGIRQVTDCLIASQTDLRKLRLLKTGLMQDLLTGNRRVTPLLDQREGVAA